jgi:hypothetical protein
MGRWGDGEREQPRSGCIFARKQTFKIISAGAEKKEGARAGGGEGGINTGAKGRDGKRYEGATVRWYDGVEVTTKRLRD